MDAFTITNILKENKTSRHKPNLGSEGLLQ